MECVATIEGGCEQQRPSRSGLGDRPTIVGAILGLDLVQHPGVARRFLVEAKSGVGDPGERIEPLEAEDKGEEVDDEVARTVVGKLMLERQTALVRRVEQLEVGGTAITRWNIPNATGPLTAADWINRIEPIQSSSSDRR